MAANFIICFGLFISYSGKISESSFFERLFIPDASVYLTLFILVLMYYRKKEKIPLFSAAAFFGMLKYSMSLLFLIFTNLSYYFLSDFSGFFAGITLMLIVVFIEAILILPLPKINLLLKSLLFFWFLFNDFIDYFFGLHTILPYDVSPFYFFVVNLAISFSIFMIIVSKKVHGRSVK